MGYDPDFASTMARLSRTFIVMSLLAAAACGGSDDPSPPSSPPPSGSGDTVTGRERFVWTQAGSVSDATALQFAVYVDGARRVLEGATCAAGSGSGLECSAPLPSLNAGRHTLELAAFYASGETITEGPKSAPLQLTVASVTAASGASPSGASAVPAAPPPASGPVVASDGSALHAEVLGADLLDPVDLAVDPAGRSFVVERAGGLRIFDQDGSATDGDRADDLSSAREPDAIVLSIALAPDFAASHLVYVLKATSSLEASRSPGQALLVRYRESDGRLGEAAVIASLPLAGTDPTGVIRFGPDRALYVGLGSRAADADSAPAAVEEGRILRLTADGRTPRDNPRASPVFSSGHRDPSGFAWPRAGRTFWEVESGADADELNLVRAGGHYGWPSVSGRARLSGASSPTVLLPPGTLPSGMTTVNDDRSPLDADLIVSSVGLQDLLRLDLTPDGQPVAGDPVRLLQGRFGAIGQVMAGPDGAVYFITRNRETWGPGRDAIVRLRPRVR